MFRYGAVLIKAVVFLVIAASMVTASSSGSQVMRHCRTYLERPVCSIAKDRLTIEVETEADIPTIDGLEAARDEALLNAQVIIAEAVLALACRRGKCLGVGERKTLCPVINYKEQGAGSFSTTLSQITWSVTCIDENSLVVSVSFSKQLCSIVTRLGRRCF